jgi:hypothetical protein
MLPNFLRLFAPKLVFIHNVAINKIMSAAFQAQTGPEPKKNMKAQ